MIADAAVSPALEALHWNNRHQVGEAVTYRNDSGITITTATRTEACVLGGHTAVIWLEDIAGCVALARVTPAPAPIVLRVPTQGVAS